jgi:Protein of unknown function (DUF2889)
MPLPPAAAIAREPVHTRRIAFECFRRGDGLWDIEGRMVDTKPFDLELSSGRVPANGAIHDMHLRLTIDTALTIVDAAVATDAMPYTPACAEIAPDYREALIGLNLGRGFRRAVLERLGGVAGCTHMTEMLLQCSTVAVQMLAGFKRDNADVGGQRPFQLDRCHALDTRGETVRRFYPRWFDKEFVRSGTG